MPISIEEFLKLPEKSRLDYLRDSALDKMRSEGFTNIQREKDDKRFGIEIWTHRKLYEKLRDYKETLDEIIIVVPATKAKLWCLEVPEKYWR